MPNLFDPVLAGIVRILDRQQRVAGTGFVIALSPQSFAWIMTSSQVIELATGLARNEILGSLRQEAAHVSIVFHIDHTEQLWDATIVNWLGSERENICVLQVKGSISPLVRRLPLIRATHAEGRRVSIFGYPAEHAPLEGAWRYSEICRPGPKLIATRHIFLQIETQEMTNSYRGAPVWDDIRRRVLGIVVEIERQGDGKLQLENTYAVPAEVIETIRKDTFRAYEVPIATNSPYHSNEPFTEGDAESFHGYETVIDKLLDRLDGTHKILVMLGPEKSGKTSVIQAGLLPRLRNMYADDHPDWSIFKTALSTDNPLGELEQQGLTGASDNLVSSLHMWQQKHGSSKMVLILDDFEEILLHCPFEKQQYFVQHLLQSVEEQAASILLVVRDTFYSLLAKHENLILQGEENFINVFSPQKKEDLISMVRQRSDIPDVLLKPELLEKIYEKATVDISTPSDKQGSTIARFETLLEQAYLQHQQQSIDQSDKDKPGIVEINLDALSVHTGDWAENIYLSLGKAERVVQHLLTQMVLLGEDGVPDTKYYRPIDDLCADDADKYDLLTTLIDKEFLITNRDRSTGKEVITLAQDALLREWARMRTWLDEKRRFLLWRQDLQMKLQKWQVESANTHVDDEAISHYLLKDISLAEAIRWSDLYAHDLNSKEIFFIQTSRSYQQKNEKRQLIELRNTINKEIKQKQEEEEKRKSVRLAQHLATQAKSIYEKHPRLLQHSVVLAATSLSLAPSPEADHTLREGLALLPRVEKYIHINANIYAADFSQDGRYVAVANDRDVYIKYLSTGDDCLLLPHETKVVAMAFSSDSEYLLTADDSGNVQAWNLSNQPAHFLYQKEAVISIKFSPNGRYVAIYYWETSTRILEIYESTNWSSVYKEPYNECIHSIMFSSDDNILAIGWIDGTISMYSLRYKRYIFTLIYKKRTSFVAISSSAHYIAIADEDGEVALFQLPISDIEHSLALNTYETEIRPRKISSQQYTEQIRKMQFDPSSSHLIIACNDATIRIWKFSDEQAIEVQTLLHNEPVYQLAVSQDSVYLATSSEDQTLRVWEIHTGQEIARFTHGQYVENLAFSKERHYLFTAGDDCEVRVWGIIKSQQCLLFAQGLSIHAVQWRPFILDLAVWDENGNVTIWGIERGYDPQIRLQLASPQPIKYFNYSPDGKYIVTESATSILLWDANSGEHRQIQSIENGYPHAFAFSHDSNLLAIASGTTVMLWETISGQLKISHEYEEQIHSIVFHASDKFLMLGFVHGYLHFWHWQRGYESPMLFSLHNEPKHMLILSPNGLYLKDGYHLAEVGGDGFACVWVWETERNKPQIEISHEMEIHTICSPNGQLIATIFADNHAEIRDIMDGCVLFQQETISDLIFSPDSLYLATTDDTNDVSIWNATNGNKIVALPHNDEVVSFTFSSDGTFLATGSKDGTVKSWTWQPKDLIQDVCQRMTRNLTQEEWQKYAGKDEPYYKINSDLP